MEIGVKLLATLVKDSYKLYCLEKAGVEKWNGYLSALSSKDSELNYWDYAHKSDAEVVALFLDTMEYLKIKNSKR